MGYPVARDMDGQVLTQAFHDWFLSDAPVRYIETYEDRVRGQEDSEEMDYEKIEQRLKSMGYL
jgi:hypothetical protein